MILRIDHISIAVKDFNSSEKFFSELLGLVPGGTGRDSGSGFSWKIYSSGDLSRFELIAPEKNGSFLDGFFKSRDGGVHHITFQVDDIYKTKTELDKKGIPYFGFNDRYSNWKELFIHPRDAFGVLIQLAEFSPEEWIDESLNMRGGKKWFVEKMGDSTKLSFAHPGGGKVDIELSEDEIDQLVMDLKK